ncbi:MAG: fasciclin domain-containing protein [Leptolyngbyaceae cyanobacterium SM2_3_12]|nr:fasciclin domain-containing protein [Leptolyngbyaceae cyanobacterium SM2_3_12]
MNTMNPNTIRIALGLGFLAAAPVAMATFPPGAMSESVTPQVESQVESQVEPQVEEPQASDAGTITAIASGNEDFEILTAALEAAGLAEALDSSEVSVTVFAPTDAAFEALPEGTVDTLLLPENKDQLAQLLTYHVVEGEVYSSDLTSGEVATVAGSPITVMVDGEAVTINDANVVGADIQASNGVIHVIDAVLLPM